MIPAKNRFQRTYGNFGAAALGCTLHFLLYLLASSILAETPTHHPRHA